MKKLQGLIQDFILWYMRKHAGGEFHFNPYGRHDAGYIVKMNERDYHAYKCIAHGRSPDEFHKMVWALRDAGLWIP